MSIQPQVQLKTTAVLNIPLQSYDSDFTFIVNEQEFKTSSVISDLISPVISHIHQNDPNSSIFNISTENQGDFNNILKLAAFHPISILDSEIPFFAEVIEILGTDSIDISNLIQNELTNDNVINYLQQHEKCVHVYSQKINEEIEYISSHFFVLCERYREEMKKLNIDTIERIISSSHLQLYSEDQLIRFINFLYQDENEVNADYSFLYGYLIFPNISTDAIGEFIDHFQKDDLTKKVWNSISQRLRQSIPNDQMIKQPGRCKLGKKFVPNGESNFNGIIKYLVDESNGNISEKVNITASPNYNGEEPYVVTQFDKENEYQSTDVQGSWICFDFKDCLIIPTNYQIKSYFRGPSSQHPKTWVIEGKSDENSQWENLGGESDCPYLNGTNVSHIFPITNLDEKKYRYIRMRQTGPNWGDRHYLTINSFEFYGVLTQ